MYKMTKGPLSKIRNTASEVKELQAAGFVIDGECDKDGNIISTSIVLDGVESTGDTDDRPKRPYTRKAKEE